ncbi:armadillo-type protein [Haematococcus lacustris]
MASLPQWKGLFDWSLQYQDGSAARSWDPAGLDPEKLKWLEEAMQGSMQDHGRRLRQIKQALDAGLSAGCAEANPPLPTTTPSAPCGATSLAMTEAAPSSRMVGLPAGEAMAGSAATPPAAPASSSMAALPGNTSWAADTAAAGSATGALTTAGASRVEQDRQLSPDTGHVLPQASRTAAAAAGDAGEAGAGPGAGAGTGPAANSPAGAGEAAAGVAGDTAVVPAGLDPHRAPGSGVGPQAATAPRQQGAPVPSLADMEEQLDELMDIVTSIDFARDLHKVGGLSTLLALLACPQHSLQWRAAEVAATCMANNPPVQQWFFEGGLLPALMPLLQPPGGGSPATLPCTKALLALSALLQHHPAAQQAFLKHQGGVPLLVRLLDLRDPRVQRKALGLLLYCCGLGPAEQAAATAAGAATAAARLLAHTPEQLDQGAGSLSELRTVALQLLQLLAAGGKVACQVVARAVDQEPGLLCSLADALQRTPPDDTDMFTKELAALRQLNATLAGLLPPPPTQQQEWQAQGRGQGQQGQQGQAGSVMAVDEVQQGSLHGQHEVLSQGAGREEREVVTGAGATAGSAQFQPLALLPAPGN